MAFKFYVMILKFNIIYQVSKSRILLRTDNYELTQGCVYMDVHM